MAVMHRLIAFRIPGTQQIYPWHAEAPDGEIVDLQGDDARFEVDSVEALVDLAMAGLGVTAVAGYLAHESLEAGDLVRLLPEYTMPSVTCYVCYHHRQYIPQRVRTLIDFLVDEFGLARPYVR